MVTDQKYYYWISSKARKTAHKYGVDEQDLLQEFFVSALEGKTAKFEHVFYNAIRKDYCRGITGRQSASDFSESDDVLVNVKDNRRAMSDYDFIEYLCDLKALLTDNEYKLVCLYLAGFDQGEIYESTKDASRRELAALWKRLGLRRGIA